MISKKESLFNNDWHSYDTIINTISPDLLFKQCYGELPYVGLDLQLIVLPMEYCFPESVYFLYYANNEPFKRLVEYKKFTKHKSKTTLLGMETPSMNGKHYPLPIKSHKALAKKYFDLMPENVYTMGRAGCYDYGVDIDDCILQGLELNDKI